MLSRTRKAHYFRLISIIGAMVSGNVIFKWRVKKLKAWVPTMEPKTIEGIVQVINLKKISNNELVKPNAVGKTINNKNANIIEIKIAIFEPNLNALRYANLNSFLPSWVPPMASMIRSDFILHSLQTKIRDHVTNFNCFLNRKLWLY